MRRSMVIRWILIAMGVTPLFWGRAVARAQDAPEEGTPGEEAPTTTPEPGVDAGEPPEGGEAGDPGEGDTLPGDGVDDGDGAAPSEDLSLDEEEAEIAAELARMGSGGDGGEEDGGQSRARGGAPASARGLSNLMNPAISATGLVLGGYSSRGDGAQNEGRGDLRSGIDVQEVEVRVSAVVDPYFRADVTISGTAEGLELEEAFVTTLEIPRLTIRAGKLLANLGRHNILHTHAFPFFTAPLPWRALLGPEGLEDPGVSADLLLPLPFFAEINAQVFAGEWAPFVGEIADDPATPADESVPDRRRDRDLAYLGHLKLLFDLDDSSTIEMGGTWIGGRNGFGRLSQIVGADLTIKWRPIEAERYRGLDWTTEYLWVDRPGDPGDGMRRRGGAYSTFRYQLAQRWWAQVGGALLGLPASAEGRTWRAEALVAFVPSEFSAIRAQYAFEALESGASPAVHELLLQLIFSVGSHPTHAY